MKKKQEESDLLMESVERFLTYDDLVKKKLPPSSVEDFYKFRKEIYDFILSTLQTRVAIINAEVKVGKKDQIIFHSLFTRSHNSERRTVHFVVTALMRKEIEEQAEQLENAGLIVLTKKRHSEKDSDIVELAIQKVKKELSEGRKVIIHFDESDYGTHFKSKWSPLFEHFLHNELCSWRLYSATNEEAELSKLAKDYDAKVYKYIPPKFYRGAKWLLDNNLVEAAFPFFAKDSDGDMEVTDHGNSILEKFLSEDQKKPILIVRHSIGNDEYKILSKSCFKSEMIKHNVDVMFVDANNDFKWAQGTVDAVNRYIASDTKTMIILNQKASRSTEIYCHKYLYGFHDCRLATTNYNTYLQSSLRVAHFDEKGHHIRLWSDVNVIRKAAGTIGNSEFLDSGRNLSSRIGKSVKTTTDVQYRIFDSKNQVPKECFTYRNQTNTFWTVSKNNKRNLAKDILDGKIDLSIQGSVGVIYIDGPNESSEENKDAWEELKTRRPDLVGKWITHGTITKTKHIEPYTKNGESSSSVFNKVA